MSASIAIWILVAPLAVGVFDLVRTLSALKTARGTPQQAGAWSSALHVNGR